MAVAFKTIELSAIALIFALFFLLLAVCGDILFTFL